jgi:hypothetical protein
MGRREKKIDRKKEKEKERGRDSLSIFIVTRSLY